MLANISSRDSGKTDDIPDRRDAGPYKVLSLSVGEGLAPPVISEKRTIFRGVKGAAPYHGIS